MRAVDIRGCQDSSQSTLRMKVQCSAFELMLGNRCQVVEAW